VLPQTGFQIELVAHTKGTDEDVKVAVVQVIVINEPLITMHRIEEALGYITAGFHQCTELAHGSARSGKVEVAVGSP
jgi:hypothetical protein